MTKSWFSADTDGRLGLDYSNIMYITKYSVVNMDGEELILPQSLIKKIKRKYYDKIFKED